MQKKTLISSLLLYLNMTVNSFITMHTDKNTTASTCFYFSVCEHDCEPFYSYIYIYIYIYIYRNTDMNTTTFACFISLGYKTWVLNCVISIDFEMRAKHLLKCARKHSNTNTVTNTW